MWQFILKCLVVCGLGYAVLAVVIYTATGRTWQPKIELPSFGSSTAASKMKTLEAPTEPTWRWRQNGRWHYGDKPPAGVKAERIDKSEQD